MWLIKVLIAKMDNKGLIINKDINEALQWLNKYK